VACVTLINTWRYLPILPPDNPGFSDAEPLLYAVLMTDPRPAPTLAFSLSAVLALPHQVTDCEGALVKGNRDESGHAPVLCRFVPGDLVRPLPSGLPVGSALVLSLADARPRPRTRARG
jgi:hypothetical protein